LAFIDNYYIIWHWILLLIIPLFIFNIVLSSIHISPFIYFHHYITEDYIIIIIFINIVIFTSLTFAYTLITAYFIISSMSFIFLFRVAAAYLASRQLRRFAAISLTDIIAPLLLSLLIIALMPLRALLNITAIYLSYFHFHYIALFSQSHHLIITSCTLYHWYFLSYFSLPFHFSSSLIISLFIAYITSSYFFRYCFDIFHIFIYILFHLFFSCFDYFHIISSFLHSFLSIFFHADIMISDVLRFSFFLSPYFHVTASTLLI